jgi:hypothetical protein
MRQLFNAGLASAHPACQGSLVKLTTFILFVRGHYLRMPWHMLLPHLLHQALRQDREKN